MKHKLAIFLTAIILVIIGIAFYSSQMTGNVTENKMTKVKFETNYGNITIQLYSDMPITTGNFEKLVKQGFYDGTISHRIIDGFMIQAGDPTGTGMGGPGYKIHTRWRK